MAININEFMEEYNKTDDKEGLVIQHIKSDYVPFETKADIAKAIVDNSYWRNMKDIDGNEHRELFVDSVAKHLLTCMTIVDLYTDIDRQKGNGKMLEDFNVLNGSGVLDYILDNVDERELDEFRMVLQMTCDDVLRNEYENHAYITKQLNRFGEIFKVTLSPVFDKLDIGKIQEVVEQLK